MSDQKRRLEMMPEVLPAPTPLDSKSNVRARTLSHMRHLLAGVAAIPAASCTKSDTQATQTVTIPVTSSSASEQSTAEGSLLPHPTATATATATAPSDMGYAVVDPMPSPARCMGLASASRASAVFKRDASGFVLEVSVTLPASWTGPMSPNTHATFLPAVPPQVWSGTLVSSSIHASTATARVRVTAGNTNAGLSFSVDCGAQSGPGQLSVNAVFTTPFTDATKVTITTHDY